VKQTHVLDGDPETFLQLRGEGDTGSFYLCSWHADEIGAHAIETLGVLKEGLVTPIPHVPDDAASLASIARRLKPGGRFVMTVPAHRWMWSAHDEVNHHQRRYSKRALKRLVEGSPLKLESIGYLNSLLFPLAVAQRLASRVSGREDSDLSLPPAPVNYLLERAFAAERRLIGRVPLPPGLSLFAVASAT